MIFKQAQADSLRKGKGQHRSAVGGFGFIPKGAIGKTVGLSYKQAGGAAV